MLRKILIASAMVMTFSTQAAMAEEVDIRGLTCEGLITLVDNAPEAEGGAALLLALGHYLSVSESAAIDLSTVSALVDGLARHCALPAHADQPLETAFAEVEASQPTP